MSIVVVYHGHCADGFCAAWLAHRHWPHATLVPANYGEDPPWELVHQNTDVIVADFSYPREKLLKLKEQANTLRVLDHHKTAQADLAGLDFCTFDMSKSGARLMQEHLKIRDDFLVDYVEDRDLWTWKLPRSAEVNAAIASYPLTLEAWDQMATRGRDALAADGVAILRYQKQLVEQIAKQAAETEIAGHRVLSANSPVLSSEVGNVLAEGRPFAHVWCVQGNGLVRHSLRSKDTGEDVAAIAKTLGGGGHRNAAGFTSTREDHLMSDYNE